MGIWDPVEGQADEVRASTDVPPGGQEVSLKSLYLAIKELGKLVTEIDKRVHRLTDEVEHIKG